MEIRRRGAACSILALAALGGCGGGDNLVAPAPSNLAIASDLSIASGNNQRGVAGATVAAPLEVTVTNSEGNPVAGVRVNWLVTANEGSLSAVNTLTNSDGRTSVEWTLGRKTGSHSVEAIVVTVASPALFSATASPPAVSGYDGTAWSKWNGLK